jgi:large subunit ribosomal protein L10
MPKTREQKAEILANLQTTISGKVALLVNYLGLTVKDTEVLRDELFSNQSSISIVKNSILKKAVEKAGFDIDESITDQPLAILSAEDEVALSKILAKFAKAHEKVEIVGGWVDGKYIDAEYIVKLSKLPGREELLAKLVGSINAPISGMVNVLAGNIRGLVSVIKQYAEKTSSS